MRRRHLLTTALAAPAIWPSTARAANEIKIGSPMALSGPGEIGRAHV